MFGFNKKEEQTTLTRSEERKQSLDMANFSLRSANEFFNKALSHLDMAESTIVGDMAEAQAEIEFHKEEIKAEEALLSGFQKRTQAIDKVRKNIKSNFTTDVSQFESEEQTPPSEE
jgi:chromosome segregation ATPase